MFYHLLGDFVTVLHFLFILFVLFGGLLVLRWRGLIWIHIPAVAWGIAIELFGWYCPLTPLENWLRSSAGNEAYTSDFIEHYLLPIIYPAALTREIQLLLAGLVVLLNTAVYLFLWRRYHHDKTSDSP